VGIQVSFVRPEHHAIGRSLTGLDTIRKTFNSATL